MQNPRAKPSSIHGVYISIDLCNKFHAPAGRWGLERLLCTVRTIRPKINEDPFVLTKGAFKLRIYNCLRPMIPRKAVVSRTFGDKIMGRPWRSHRSLIYFIKQVEYMVGMKEKGSKNARLSDLRLKLLRMLKIAGLLSYGYCYLFVK